MLSNRSLSAALLGVWWMLGLAPALAQGPGGDAVPVLRSQNLEIYLEERRDGRNPAHPVRLDPAALQARLAQLRVEGSAGAVAPFAGETAATVAQGLSRALAKAGPAQDVVMFFWRPVGNLLSSRRYLSTVRVFYDQEALNLLFGEVDQLYNEWRDRRIQPLATGSREGGSRMRGRLLDSAGGRPVAGRADWVVLEELEGGTAPATPAAPVQAPEPAAQPAPAAIPPPASRISWEELEKGLATLKRLRDQGLINDRDYEAKKQQLLEAAGP